MLLAVAYPWSKRKGLDDYIALSKILPQNYLLVLVGLNRQQMEMLPPNVFGVGRVRDYSEMLNLYAMSTIVLNLSYAETFGLTTVEGFACGKPCIVYNVTASPELVTPSTGLVCEPGNVEAVKEAVEIIVSNKKRYSPENCRKRAELSFSKKVNFRKYIQLYEQLLSV